MPRPDDVQKPERVALDRRVTLTQLVLYGLGTTVGAGIYALSGLVAGRAGMQAPIAFLVASILALVSALSFGELAARFPRAGGEPIYVLYGLRRRDAALVVALLAVLASVVSAATISVAFAGYLGSLLPAPAAVTAAALVLALGAVAAWGVRQSILVVGAVTLLEVAGLLAVLAWGHGHLLDLPERASSFVPLDAASWAGVASGAVIAFYAFIGFEDMVNLAEEVQRPRRTLPLAIVLTLGITVVIYMLIAGVAVLAVDPRELARSDAPMALVFERSGGSARVLGAIALVALLNGVLIQMVKAARILYGMGREGILPARLARVHPVTRTPLVATLLVVGLTLVFALTLPLETLAELTASVALLVFALANLALFAIKRRGSGEAPAFRVPLAVPALGCAVSLGLLAVRAAQAFLSA